MSIEERISRDIERYRNDPEFELEMLLLDVNEQICALMDDQGVRRTELAEKIGVSRAYITKLLRGEANVTLKTLVGVANALEAKFEIKLSSRDTGQLRATPQRSPAARARAQEGAAAAV